MIFPVLGTGRLSLWDQKNVYDSHTKNFGIAGSIGILALNCIVGGLIGGVVVILRMVMVLMEIIKIISDTSGHDVQGADEKRK